MNAATYATAARALLAFWRAAGVDMDGAEAVFTRAEPQAPPSVQRPSPAPKATTVRAKAGPSPVETARALAAAAKTIPELRTAVESFDGCALKATARNTVFSDGVENAPVLLIGEAPGKDEDEKGKPFVGRSGQLLDRILAHAGLNRQTNLLISNTIYWRPPGNRDPTQGETIACLPFVERLIALSRPRLLILAGKSAAQTLLKRDDGVLKLRGRRLLYKQDGLDSPINAMVMLHPAYLLRQPHQKRLAWADVLAANTWLEELGIARAPRT
jgi:uracil-DNA glycosylase